MTTQEILQGVHDWTNGKIVYDISVAHPDGQGNPTPYADLTAALGNGGANIPEPLRKGGMSVKFIKGSDNKYVQFRYIGTSTANADFANTMNWLSVEDEVIRQTGTSVSQTAALVVSESNQNIRVNLPLSDKGTFKVVFDGGTSSAFAIKLTLFKDAMTAQDAVYESNRFGFNQQIEYSGDEFNIAYFTIYRDQVVTAGNATFAINTGMVADIENNKGAIEDAEVKNLNTMFYTKGYLLSGSAVYDDNGLVISSGVNWSDGVAGTLVRSLWDDRVLEYKRDIVSHGSQSVQYDRIYNGMGEVSKETITIN